MSEDIQDIVAVIDGRPEIIDEIKNAPEDLREYLRKEFKVIGESEQLKNFLPGLLDRSSQNRIPIIMERIKKIAAIK